MNETNTIDNAARVAGRKLVARNPKTGRYFDGTNFDNIESNALALRPGTTAEDFRFSWTGPVEVIEVPEPAKAANIYDAAREYVVKRQRDGQKSFFVRMSDGKEYSRRVTVDSRRSGHCAWVRFNGDQIALALVGGELRGDR